VPAHVVHVLEAVEVDDDEGEGLVVSHRAPQRLLDAIVEQDAVRQTRQGIAHRIGPGAPKPPLEHQRARRRDDGEDEEHCDDPVRTRLQPDRRRSGDEDERSERKCPRKGAADLPPVPVRHLVLSF
jgi:hypothetical protein